ncbi:DNA-binding response regulator [Stenotrophomonas sp. LMG 10879]|uniref:response regulator transcription factor n=1 Tax=unclassified Stenotrophomonas TaxID=196198 RepID=UPI000C18B676|nr:response regulator transcription factor [Stenotrophomonas sp. LMG 10879]PII21741.1 DNA-binding response regulator [Stenotrophomonas sp. LMG 10879]HED4874981.1 response regulator transcription factor [Stenotrophomonas maltophilia]
MPLNIVVADDHPVLLAGMEHLLEAEPDLAIAGLVRDSTELVDLLSRTPVDVAVCDFSMPNGRYGDGVTLLRFLQRRFPALHLVVLTGMESPMVLRSIQRAGVSCIVSKSDPLEQLVPAVHAASRRQAFISAEIARLIVEDDPHDDVQEVEALSKRESEVLRMFAEGLSVMQIAERVGRSRKTISTQKIAAMRKLGLQRDAEIFEYALTHGLVQASQNARAGAGGEGSAD